MAFNNQLLFCGKVGFGRELGRVRNYFSVQKRQHLEGMR